MSSQGDPIVSGLVLGIFLGFGDKNQKKALISPLSKHWINLSWTGIVNPCQGQGIDLVHDIHLHQIIFHLRQ